MVATLERLWTVAEDSAGEVKPGSVEIETLWLVSTEGPEVSSRFLLPFSKVPLGEINLAAVVSLSAGLLRGVSTVGSDVVDSVALTIDEYFAEVVVLVRCDIVSVESGNAIVSEVDRVIPPSSELWSVSETTVVSISTMVQLITSVSVMA